MTDQAVKVREKWTWRLERTSIDSDATAESNDIGAGLYLCVRPNNGNRPQKEKWRKSSPHRLQPPSPSLRRLTYDFRCFPCATQLHVVVNCSILSRCVECRRGLAMRILSVRLSVRRFRLVPTSMTLNDLKRRNRPYFSFFRRIR